MRDRTKIFIIVSIIITAFAVGAAAAQQLDSATISSGGALDLTDGTIHLQDIKGQSAAGVVTDGTTTVEIGGLYTELTEEVIIIPDTGIVKDTVIFRAANEIKLSWDKGTAAAVDIWSISGPGVEFSKTVAWTKILANFAGAEFPDPNVKVGDGKNAFYRVVPVNTAPADIHDPALNSKTVGKVDVNFLAGYTLFEVPLWTNDMTISTVIGTQLDNNPKGDELYDYNLSKSTFAGGVWVGNPLSFQKGRGYYMRIINTPKYLTFVGAVDLANVNLRLNTGYSMTGNPFPIIKDVPDAFKNAASGDELYDKLARKKTNTAQGWVGANYQFGLGDGFWFRRVSNNAYDWALQP